MGHTRGISKCLTNSSGSLVKYKVLVKRIFKCLCHTLLQ